MYNIVEVLLLNRVSVGIPTMRSFHMEGEYNLMVMDLLGPSLEDQFEACGKRFRSFVKPFASMIIPSAGCR